jgi:hypothetical protein
MWRSLIAAALLYGYGHPVLDSVRPGFLDGPLQGLHREVNQAAVDGHRALTMLDDARSMRYMKRYTDEMSALLKGG